MHYALAQLTIDDPATYGRYQARFMQTLVGTDGRLLAADDAPLVVEGEWDFQKVVLLAFPDVASFKQWATSDAYEEIARLRRTATKGPIISFEGIPS